MTPEENKQIAELMRSEKERARGYADYFGWSINRDLEEMNVVKQLAIGLEKDNKLFFSNIQARGRPNDPPDCEAVIGNNERIAIEVTELVDGNAIRAFKAGATYEWAEWDKKKFLSSIEEAITSKDSRFPMLKGAPYPGGYIVVIYTDEPDLNQETVKGYLNNHEFCKPLHATNVYILLSYDPNIKGCPYFEL